MSESPETKRIQVTHENADILAVGLLNNVVEQNKIMIALLQSLNGSISKIANVDLETPDESKRD